MILTLDMGNSNIVIGGIDEKNTYFMERITTDTRKTDLEYAVSIKNIFEIHHLDPASVEGAILSSVVPPLNPVLTAAVRQDELPIRIALRFDRIDQLHKEIFRSLRGFDFLFLFVGESAEDTFVNVHDGVLLLITHLSVPIV